MWLGIALIVVGFIISVKVGRFLGPYGVDPLRVPGIFIYHPWLLKIVGSLGPLLFTAGVIILILRLVF